MQRKPSEGLQVVVIGREQQISWGNIRRKSEFFFHGYIHSSPMLPKRMNFKREERDRNILVIMHLQVDN